MGLETLAAVTAGAAVIGMGASVAGAAVGAQGAQATADATSKSAQYQAAVARNNKIIADQYAERSIMAGLTRSEMQGYKTRAAVGTAKVTQAASGIDVNSGSAVDVRRSIAELGELDAETIRYNAAQEGYSARLKAAGFEAESELAMQKSDYAKIAGEYGVATSILGGVSSVSDKWMSYKSKGVF